MASGEPPPPPRDKLPTFQDLDVFAQGAPRATSQHPPDRGVLVQTTGLDTGRMVPLSLDAVTLGRCAECTVVLADEDAAPVHARVVHEGGAWYVEDAGGGTTLDGLRTERAMLSPGAHVQLASVTFRYQLVDANEEQALSALYASSVRDGLTGLFNRAHLLVTLGSDIAYAHRTGEPLAIAILDVVGMRALNAAYGYRGGDEALKRIASLARGVAGEAPLFRSAGAELALILRGEGAEAAARLGERIRDAVSAPIALAFAEVAVRVRVSVASLAGHETAAQLLERARPAAGSPDR